MAKKKWVIDESIPRTPEKRKWVEDQLNRERTPKELKREILGLPCYKPAGGANWMIWFNKKINARLPTCMMDSEIYFKEVEEEGEYADSHFSEIKRGIIDIIKQNPQEWEIKEKNVHRIELEGLPENEWKSKHMVVRKKGIIGGKHHSKNGFTKEEWIEIENALNCQQKKGSHDRSSIIKKVEELCVRLIQNYEERNGQMRRFNINKGNEDEGERIKERYLKRRSEIYREIKDQILKDLTLWELDAEGNIQPVPGISVNTNGAGGGYILFSYQPSTSYIHFFFEEPNKKYKKEITRAFVEEIKQNPQDWEIILEVKRDKPFVPKPMVANTRDCQVVKNKKTGRRHNRGYQWYKNEKGEVEGPGFSNEEWAEIENVLNKHKPKGLKQPEKNPPIKNNVNWNQETKTLLKQFQELKDGDKTEELIKWINQLKEIIKQLEIENEQLKKEIQELKAKKDNSPEHQTYLVKKETELKNKQQKLNELKGIAETNNNSKTLQKKNNFPTGLVVGGIGAVTIIILAGAAIMRGKRRRRIEKKQQK